MYGGGVMEWKGFGIGIGHGDMDRDGSSYGSEQMADKELLGII